MAGETRPPPDFSSRKADTGILAVVSWIGIFLCYLFGPRGGEVMCFALCFFATQRGKSSLKYLLIITGGSGTAIMGDEEATWHSAKAWESPVIDPGRVGGLPLRPSLGQSSKNRDPAGINSSANRARGSGFEIQAGLDQDCWLGQGETLWSERLRSWKGARI